MQNVKFKQQGVLHTRWCQRGQQEMAESYSSDDPATNQYWISATKNLPFTWWTRLTSSPRQPQPWEDAPARRWKPLQSLDCNSLLNGLLILIKRWSLGTEWKCTIDENGDIKPPGTIPYFWIGNICKRDLTSLNQTGSQESLKLIQESDWLLYISILKPSFNSFLQWKKLLCPKLCWNPTCTWVT